MRGPLNHLDRELLQAPTISAQMPIEFANGACWEVIEGHCLDCRRLIDPDLFRGRVDRIIESTATVRAVGLCRPCNLLTRFEYRLHSDMTISGIKDKRWVRWSPGRSREVPWAAALRKLFLEIRRRR